MLAALMRMPSKRPAIIISTIQFAWHNNNFIMQNMYLKKQNLNQVRKAQLNFRATIYEAWVSRFIRMGMDSLC